jgi:hypothetical protein
MIAPKDPIINGIDVSKYKEHPRILELRFGLFFLIVAREYGHNGAIRIYQKLSEIFRVDFNKIQTVINAIPSVQVLKRRDKWRYRQDVALMGHLFNESGVEIANKYLKIHTTTYYRQKEILSPKYFVNEEWLAGLDDSIIICGVETYRLEIIRFIEEFEFFLEVMGNVSLSTKDLRSIRFSHER